MTEPTFAERVAARVKAGTRGPCFECGSRTAFAFRGDGCSDCLPDCLDVDPDELREAADTDARIREWKDGQP